MNSEQARTNMLKQQIRTWNVTDQTILDLFAKVPRELFIPERYRNLAFADTNIPLGHGQTTMTPKEEARILQSLSVKPTDKILVLGTGNGYLTALLAKLGKVVYSVDSVPEFNEQAKKILSQLKIQNVIFNNADVSKGWELEAPYDVIVITGSLPSLPNYIRDSLAVNGRLFAIIGPPPVMEATLVKRVSPDQLEVDKIFETSRPRLTHVNEPRYFQF